jgi:hypothetical protein
VDLLGALALVCKQYGPRRLPYAHRRGAGAGYATVTVVAVTTTVFVLATQLVGIGALGTTFWLTLPLGVLGGYTHEQARLANSTSR